MFCWALKAPRQEYQFSKFRKTNIIIASLHWRPPIRSYKKASEILLFYSLLDDVSITILRSHGLLYSSLILETNFVSSNGLIWRPHRCHSSVCVQASPSQWFPCRLEDFLRKVTPWSAHTALRSQAKDVAWKSMPPKFLVRHFSLPLCELR